MQLLATLFFLGIYISLVISHDIPQHTACTCLACYSHQRGKWAPFQNTNWLFWLLRIPLKTKKKHFNPQLNKPRLNKLRFNKPLFNQPQFLSPNASFSFRSPPPRWENSLPPDEWQGRNYKRWSIKSGFPRIVSHNAPFLAPTTRCEASIRSGRRGAVYKCISPHASKTEGLSWPYSESVGSH